MKIEDLILGGIYYLEDFKNTNINEYIVLIDVDYKFRDVTCIKADYADYLNMDYIKDSLQGAMLYCKLKIQEADLSNYFNNGYCGKFNATTVAQMKTKIRYNNNPFV